ncbi:MAG: outer membrane beta-barrel protein [Verrucomicrobiota bacterium]
MTIYAHYWSRGWLIAALAVSQFVSSSLSLAQNLERAGKTSAEKPFVINMTVRGEYDDNVNTSVDGQEDAAFIINLRPSITFSKNLDNTQLEFGYTFGFKQFFGREGNDEEDFSHTFNGTVSHRFNERFSVQLTERFSFDQEDPINQGGIARRVGGDRIRNNFGVIGSYDWTERFSTLTRYDNEYLEYFDRPASTVNNFLSHEVSQQLRFQAMRTTTPFANYVFKTTDYESIARDRDEHRALAGIDHYLLENWLLSAQAGAEFVFYDNSLFDDTIGPYAYLSTQWNYSDKSNVLGSYTFGTSNTDNSTFSSSTSHTLVGTITHYFTNKFSVGAIGRYELADFDTSQGFAAATSDVTEQTITAGVNARFEFTDYLSADAGYTYTEVISDTNAREYDRNRVYIGISGSY